MKGKTLEETRNTLDACIDRYVELFCEKHDYNFDGWVGGEKGTIGCFNEMYLNFQDICLDLDKNCPKESISDWYWGNMENTNRYINYYSYSLGLRVRHLDVD